jgi:hypothetical protein
MLLMDVSPCQGKGAYTTCQFSNIQLYLPFGARVIPTPPDDQVLLFYYPRHLNTRLIV